MKIGDVGHGIGEVNRRELFSSRCCEAGLQLSKSRENEAMHSGSRNGSFWNLSRLRRGRMARPRSGSFVDDTSIREHPVVLDSAGACYSTSSTSMRLFSRRETTLFPRLPKQCNLRDPPGGRSWIVIVGVPAKPDIPKTANPAGIGRNRTLRQVP
jgi:hypothetical protein